MREATGTTTSMKMAFAFTILFAAFLAIAITYNKAFKLKNEALSILEKYEGVTEKSLGIINNYLKNNGYRTKGGCTSDEFGVDSLDVSSYEKPANGKKYYYCISYYCNSNCKINGDNKIYYKFRLFFKFNLPFLGELTTYNINGETKPIKLYNGSQKLK